MNSNKNNPINKKSTNKIKKFQKKKISKDFEDLEEFNKSEPENEYMKINSSMKDIKSSINISYSRYCNDLINKEKKNYSNKITLNKMKIYKLNKSQNLTLNTDCKYNQFYIPSKKIQKKNSKNKKKEINLEIEIKNPNPKTSLKNKKKFSFTKSKKLIRKKSEKDLKEMYLLAGTAQNEEKLFTYNDILLLTYKNSYSNSIGGDITITNNNNNLSENNYNEILEKKEKIYKKLWNEGYMKYKKLILGKKTKEEYINKNDIINIQFCMANDLIEIKADKNDLMINIKNIFLNEFLKKKLYNEQEKKYINDNIIFLKKEGDIINLNKKISENIYLINILLLDIFLFKKQNNKFCTYIYNKYTNIIYKKIF